MKIHALAGPVLLLLLFARVGAADPGPSLALYFPPVPPALGAALPPRGTGYVSAAPGGEPAGGSSADRAPSELAPYICDPFYVALSVQLARHEVGSDLSFALQSYLTTKSALLAELRARLDDVREEGPDVRVDELRKFAADQTPRLVQLEVTAEGLRRTLAARTAAHREFVRWSVDTMAPPQAKFDPSVYEAQTAMMIASFAAGPTPLQRRLLREVAQELMEPIGASGAWAFSPHGARVSLSPSDPVSPELRQRIIEYQATDRQLKTDVQKVLVSLHRLDPQPWIDASDREEKLDAQLEAQAEGIRQIVVKFRDPAAQPQPPTVPQTMAAQVARHRADKAALQRQLLQRVEAAKQAGPAESAPERIRKAIADFTAQNQARYDALDRSRDQLLRQLGEMTTPPPGAAASSPETLTNNLNQSLKELKSFWEYRDYQSAVFQPGLSPEQRRLLFEGALIKLGLPLPAAVHPVEQH